jgi:release factor glutamine methyltransferase
MDTVATSLQMAAKTLRSRSASPQLDAEVLLCKVLGTTRAALIVRGAETMPAPSLRAYQELVNRRLQGAPVAYLTGSREFWSLDLEITPEVLVPRPETELLVELALDLLPAGEARSLLDLGAGSGAVALALASERPLARVTGVEVSAGALAVARANARKLGLERVEWRLGSWFDAVPGQRFDLIAANPPYVAAGDPALADLAAEPRLALSPGQTGLEALAEIIARAAQHLCPGGWMLLEHGSTQAGDVAAMLKNGGFGAICSHLDYSGKPRVTRGTIHSSH